MAESATEDRGAKKIGLIALIALVMGSMLGAGILSCRKIWRPLQGRGRW